MLIADIINKLFEMNIIATYAISDLYNLTAVHVKEFTLLKHIILNLSRIELDLDDFLKKCIDQYTKLVRQIQPIRNEETYADYLEKLKKILKKNRLDYVARITKDPNITWKSKKKISKQELTNAISEALEQATKRWTEAYLDHETLDVKEFKKYFLIKYI